MTEGEVREAYDYAQFYSLKRMLMRDSLRYVSRRGVA
jgi:hypothetical protein